MPPGRSDLEADVKRSPIWTPEVIAGIQEKAERGTYVMHGFSTLLHRSWPTFDDLVFLPAVLTRFPVEGYMEKCETETLIGTRAPKPIRLSVPIMISGMSFGALSLNAKVSLGRAASTVGISTTTGDGGMLDEEREASKRLVYQVLPSRYGNELHQMRRADAIEIVCSQGAKPGTGGVLLGMKTIDRVARMRDLPAGVDQRGPARHPDWLTAPDLGVKIDEIREATDHQIPVIVKMGASRVRNDVAVAAKIGADAILVDGAEGGTGASPDVMLDHAGIPTLAAIPQAREALEELGLFGQVQLIAAGGIRSGVDVAKALALGADACAIGTAALIAIGCNSATATNGEDVTADYDRLGAAPGGFCHHCHTGQCPVGVTTQLPELVSRVDIDVAAERLVSMLTAWTMEATMLAKACGKSDIHSLDPDDLRALTMEASLMAKVPLAGLDAIPGYTQPPALRSSPGAGSP
jgi:glutamate synthase domain-containing protein 2